MGIAVAGIADYDSAEYVRALVPADGYLKYYIGIAGSTRGPAMDSEEVGKIRDDMKYVDNITGLAFQEVFDPGLAQVRFYKATSSYYDDSDTLGQTEYEGPDGMLVTWLDKAGSSSGNGESITIKHEIGHVAALDHPYGDGFNASYTRADTIMSYNRSVTGSASWTDSDQLALKSLWGEDRKTFVPGRGSLAGTVFADEFYLQSYDGYGDGSADIIQGFNSANGDRLQFTTIGMGWDSAKSRYSFYTLDSNTETSTSGRWVKSWKKGKMRRRWVEQTATIDKLATRVSSSDTNALIYNTSTGQLYVDRNGNSYGLGDGGLVAVLQGAPTLTTASIDWFTS